MQVLLNDQIPIGSWDLLVSNSPFASPFQTFKFYKIINSVPGISAVAIGIEDSGLLLALAVITMQKEQGPKGYFSRRGIIYGGPILNTHNYEVSDILLREILPSVGKDVIYIETRNLSDYNNFKGIFYSHGWEYIKYLNFHLNTSDKESLIQAISKSRLRQIKKAIKEGVIWKEATHLDEVKTFHTILTALYERKIKKPLLPWDFFRLFLELDFGKYLLVYYQNQIIGGIMCPILQGKAIYEFYVCGLDKEYKEQQPSVMATWAAMEYANQNKIPIFDFMGAGQLDSKYGVRDFKARFGGKEVEYGRFLKVNKPILYALGKSFIKIRHRI